MKARRTYDAELKAEAVKMAVEQGLSRGQISRRLSIPKGTIVLPSQHYSLQKMEFYAMIGDG